MQFTTRPILRFRKVIYTLMAAAFGSFVSVVNWKRVVKIPCVYRASLTCTVGNRHQEEKHLRTRQGWQVGVSCSSPQESLSKPRQHSLRTITHIHTSTRQMLLKEGSNPSKRSRHGQWCRALQETKKQRRGDLWCPDA